MDIKMDVTKSEEVSTIRMQNSYLVSALELHEILDISTCFEIWIERKIEELRLKQDFHYVPYEKENGLILIDDYLITIDTAKLIARLNETNSGIKIIKYLSDMEDELDSKERERKILLFPNKKENTLTNKAFLERIQRLCCPFIPEKSMILQIFLYYKIDVFEPISEDLVRNIIERFIETSNYEPLLGDILVYHAALFDDKPIKVNIEHSIRYFGMEDTRQIKTIAKKTSFSKKKI